LFGSVIIGALTYTPWFGGQTYFSRSLTTAAIVTVLWLVVMFVTKPEPEPTLDSFYARARPGGAWEPVRARTGLSSRQDLLDDILRVVAGVATIMGANIALGALLLQAWQTGLIAAIVAALGIAFLVRKRESLKL
jgi:hypothetical protein